jgi:reverse transcriptase-like protein/retrotransposon-encoded endonuclease
MSQLTILQFNCGNSNHKATRPFFEAASPQSHQVIAIQEPAFNKQTGLTYCPKGYTLSYESHPTTRVGFMISKEVGVAQWSRKQYGPYVATLYLQTREIEISIVSVYNPITPGQRERLLAWEPLETAIREVRGEVLLIGDFNSHHPAWGGRHVTSEPQAEHLLHITRLQGLHLLNPVGEATWKRGPRQSVIDLVFATRYLQNRTLFCGPEDRWAITKDHIPIRIQLDLSTAPQAPSTRYALAKLDHERFKQSIINSAWRDQPQPLQALQQVIETALNDHCPRVKPAPQARRDWSPKATELLAGARRARRRYNASLQHQDLQSAKALSNLLKKEIRRVSRNLWRTFVSDITTSPNYLNSKGLWKLSRWSRRVAGQAHTDPHLPPLRRTDQDEITSDNERKAAILAEKFFPQAGQADISDLQEAQYPANRIPIPTGVTKEEIEQLIRKLPNGKAPGPDGIPNEILKVIAPMISGYLAQAINTLLVEGQLPGYLKESITIVLRKENKKDYSLPGSYRPIALENTLAKVIEKLLADRITDAAEAHNLLSWNQMGARKQRSTLSAISLLTASVQTAWQARPGCIVSMLSLDLAGAFDHVSHERLLGILRKKAFPEWLVKLIQSFLTDRKTRIAFPGYQSEWIRTQTGIPQGSPLSPILFLFFISELLEEFQRVAGDTLGFGFVDDTNLITWGNSARENCRRLESIHDRCIAWAKRHGAVFAPDKYQLIHFTRSRRHDKEDLASTVRIEGQQAQVQDKEMRVLGVWVDPKLTWKSHIQKAARKGNAAYEALARITTSTWGPSMKKSRLLYTAVVRPVMLYGAQVWSIGGDGKQLAANTLQPLVKLQNSCLRRITGGYKRTPRAALERETAIAPLNIYTDMISLQRTLTVASHPVEDKIQEALTDIHRSACELRAGRRRTQRPSRQLTALELARNRAELIKQESLNHTQTRNRQRQQARRRRDAGHSRHPNHTTLLAHWADREWQIRWQNGGGLRDAATWKGHWKDKVTKLYEGLPKVEATALFLLRTEVIGLNAWLASIGVPEILPHCPCGWQAQTVRHILLHCPRHNRVGLVSSTQSERLHDILSQRRSARIAASWFTRQGVLQQFRVAKEILEESHGDYSPLPELDTW